MFRAQLAAAFLFAGSITLPNMSTHTSVPVAPGELECFACFFEICTIGLLDRHIDDIVADTKTQKGTRHDTCQNSECSVHSSCTLALSAQQMNSLLVAYDEGDVEALTESLIRNPDKIHFNSSRSSSEPEPVNDCETPGGKV